MDLYAAEPRFNLYSARGFTVSAVGITVVSKG
jgi:hypothetical protein